jgi:molybdopterin-binding protein
VERLRTRPNRHLTGDALSARNRFPGVVRSVEIDGVMGLVELESGPFRVTAAITRDRGARAGRGR